MNYYYYFTQTYVNNIYYHQKDNVFTIDEEGYVELTEAERAIGRENYGNKINN